MRGSIASKAGIAALGLSIGAGGGGIGLIAFGGSTPVSHASASSEPSRSRPTLSLSPPGATHDPGAGSTQVLGLTINSGPSGVTGTVFTPGTAKPGPPNAAPSTPPPPPPAGPTGDARDISTYVRNQLQALATTDRNSLKHISDAIAALNAALTPSLGLLAGDGNHVNPRSGGQVFDDLTRAIQDLGQVRKPPPTWNISTYISDIDYAARLIASTAIANNSCSARTPSELTAAKQELVNGDTEYDRANFDGAAGHYKSAWGHALNAQGISCGGLSVSPPGAPVVSADPILPGDSVGDSSTPVSVQVTGATASKVTLSESNLTQTKALADELVLTITQDGHQIYSGALDGLGTLTLVGGGTGGSWAVGESHPYVFTVTFPKTAGNSYQAGTASLNFVWNRS